MVARQCLSRQSNSPAGPGATPAPSLPLCLSSSTPKQQPCNLRTLAYPDQIFLRHTVLAPGPQRIVKLTRSKDGVTQQDLIWVRFVPLLPGQAREL